MAPRQCAKKPARKTCPKKPKKKACPKKNHCLCPTCCGKGTINKRKAKKCQRKRRTKRRLPCNNHFPAFFKHCCQRKRERGICDPGKKTMIEAADCWRCLTPAQKDHFGRVLKPKLMRSSSCCKRPPKCPPPPCPPPSCPPPSCPGSGGGGGCLPKLMLNGLNDRVNSLSNLQISPAATPDIMVYNGSGQVDWVLVPGKRI